MSKKIYIATDTDRWDHLAYDFFGDSGFVEPLIVANPGISPHQPFLPSGEKIIIPDLPPEISRLKETTVKAPWK